MTLLIDEGTLHHLTQKEPFLMLKKLKISELITLTSIEKSRHLLNNFSNFICNPQLILLKVLLKKNAHISLEFTSIINQVK